MQTLANITKFPEVATSHARELQWAVDHWQRIYAEAGYQCAQAWRLYDDAIENNEPRDHKDALYEIAQMFEANKAAAWENWQNAKRDYLAVLN